MPLNLSELKARGGCADVRGAGGRVIPKHCSCANGWKDHGGRRCVAQRNEGYLKIHATAEAFAGGWFHSGDWRCGSVTCYIKIMTVPKTLLFLVVRTFPVTI